MLPFRQTVIGSPGLIPPFRPLPCRPGKQEGAYFQ